MTITVYPGAVNPNYHVTLDDGKRKVGLILVDNQGRRSDRAISRAPVNRTAMKTTSGNQKYADYEPPWSPVAQEDFSGGMGNEDFDKDVSRFWTSSRCNTSFGKIFLGPQEHYTSGLRNQQLNMSGSVTWVVMKTGSQKYFANTFTPSTSYTMQNCYIHVRRRGEPKASLTVELCANGAGNNPGTVITSATISTTNITDTPAEQFRVTLSASLTGGTMYWLKVYSTEGDDNDNWQIGVNATSATSKVSADNTTWTNATSDLYYRITDANTGYTPYLFQYRGCQYLLTSITGSAPRLWINGDRGTADANTGALTTLVDGTKSWTVNAMTGGVVKIIKGTGVAEKVTWRRIVSNTATALTVTPAWEITHDTTTEYVILGVDTLIEITGHGLTAPVTDVMILNDYFYVCQGDSANIRRCRFYTNAGTWTAEYADDGTNKACFMDVVRESSGTQYVWKANNSGAAGVIAASRAALPAAGANMSFGAELTLLDQWGKINGTEEYENKFYMYREGTVNACAGTTMEEIKLPEIHTLMESNNGRAHMRNNCYIYFSLGSGIERYYNSSLDDVGPNRDDGLPTDRQGTISVLLGYAGRYFAAVDGDTSNYSSILMHNGTGWHDVYRAPMKGERILGLDFQTIPGTASDRMWVMVGDDVIWLPFPSLTMDPTKDSSYTFTHEGWVISGYIYSGMVDAIKFYQSMKLFAERLTTSGIQVEADYQWDDETAWTPLGRAFTTSPVDEINLRSTLGVTGKRLRYRLRLQSNNYTTTPIVKTSVVENVSKVGTKYSYGFSYRCQDDDIDLNGEIEEMSADQKQALIDEWAENFTPLTMRCIHGRYDNKTVFIDPAEDTPLFETSEGYIEKLTVVER